MRRIILALGFAMPLLTAVAAKASPLVADTASYILPTETVTLDWAVYKSGSDPFGTSGLGYVYAYTLHATAQVAHYDIHIPVGLSSTSGAGTIDSATLTTIHQTPGNTPTSPINDLLAVFQNSGTAGTPQSVTAWWASVIPPAVADVMVNGTTTTSLIAAPSTLGAPFPGAPEPRTWALLLAMMGLAAWYLRRWQHESDAMSV